MSLELNTALATQTLGQSGFDAAAKAAAQAKKNDPIEAVARDFEAMFIAEMMKPMMEGLEVDPQFGGGKGEEVFRGLMLQEYGRMVAESGQLNIAQSVKEQLLMMQEVADTGSHILGTQTQDSTLIQESVDDDTFSE